MLGYAVDFICCTRHGLPGSLGGVNQLETRCKFRHLTARNTGERIHPYLSINHIKDIYTLNTYPKEAIGTFAPLFLWSRRFRYKSTGYLFSLFLLADCLFEMETTVSMQFMGHFWVSMLTRVALYIPIPRCKYASPAPFCTLGAHINLYLRVATETVISSTLVRYLDSFLR